MKVFMKNFLINTFFLLFLASFVNCQGSRQLIRENERNMDKYDFNLYKNKVNSKSYRR